MKKFFFSSPLTAAILAALTFAACSDSDTIADGNSVNVVNTADNAIQFGTYMGTQNTRAYRGSYEGGQIANETNTDKYLTDLTKTGFGVFSYYTGDKDYREADKTWTTGSSWKTTETNKYPNFMYNQELTFDATKSWIYSPVKYWPNGVDADNKDGNPSYTATQSAAGKLSFFAYAPFTTVDDDNYVAPTGQLIPTSVEAKKTSNTDGIKAMSTNTSPTDVWVKYEMSNAAADKAVDLLWGMNGKISYDETDGEDPAVGAIGTAYNENLTKQAVKDKVKFLFKHALSKVGGATANGTETLTGDPAQCGFAVVVDVDKNSETPAVNGQSNQTTYFNSDFSNEVTLVTIKEVKIRDANTYDNEINNSTTSTVQGLPNYGWFDIETGEWSAETGTSGTEGNGATYSIKANKDDDNVTNETYTLNEKIKEIGAGKFGATGEVKKLADASGTKWDNAYPVGVTLTPTPLFTNENVPGLLLIPAQDATLYVTVDYIVRTADPNLNAGYSEVEQVITNKVTLNSTNIDPNKYYTIIMHLGLTSVKFEAKVTDWTQTSDATFNEDGTVNEGAKENAKEIWLPSNVVNYNTWDVSAPATFKAMGESSTLTVKLNDATLDYAATASNGKYKVTIPTGDDWLSVNSEGKLTAKPNTSASSRTSIIEIETVTTNGVTLKKQFSITQAGYRLSLSETSQVVSVTDGDSQNVDVTASGYTITVSGGDGYGDYKNADGSDKPLTTNSTSFKVTGTVGQTYTVTVSHTGGATATTTVTIPNP